jgi:hypothetical protein
MLMRRIAACALSLSVCLASAGTGDRLEIKHEYFWDANGVWNHTPAFSLVKSLSRVLSFGWEQELDIVTGASRRIGLDKVGLTGERAIDAVSGASKIETRHSENPSLTYSDEGRVLTGSFYYSRENDYVSLSPAVSASFDFNERNTTLGASYAEFFDDFKPTGHFAGLGGRKRIRSLGATLAQSLTPLTLLGLTATYTRSWGFLGHPYNPPVNYLGEMMTESVPDVKQAGALAGQIVQGYRLVERLAPSTSTSGATRTDGESNRAPSTPSSANTSRKPRICACAPAGTTRPARPSPRNTTSETRYTAPRTSGSTPSPPGSSGRRFPPPSRSHGANRLSCRIGGI